MKRLFHALSLIFILTAFAVPSEAGTPDKTGPLTVAEESNFTDTARYSDVMKFLGELQRLSRNIRLETICYSTEGRKVPLMILADPFPSSPADLRYDSRAVIYIQANIHPGEVEGKEAVLMLARDILLGDRADLLEDLVILIAPIFNADGNEKISTENRTNQAGPYKGVGVRHNGQRLDLNRDCVKVESPEIKGMISNVLTRWDPLLLVDCHTTNGAYHQEPVTYSWPLNPNGPVSIIKYMRNKMMPAISKRLEKNHNVLSIPYGRFADPANPEKGWSTFNENIRFVTNYVGIRNRFSILDENYVYADYKTRVYGCYYFLLTIAEYTSGHREDMIKLTEEADRKAKIRWINSEPADSFAVTSKIKATENPVTVRGYEMKVTERENRWPKVEISDKKKNYTIPYLADFIPDRKIAFPYAYLIRQPDPAIEEILLSHGIVLEKLTEAVTLKVEAFKTTELNSDKNLYQGHHLTSIKGNYEMAEMEFPEGTLFITTSQQLGSLAAHLLEPESRDGLLTWNFFDRYMVSQWRRKLLTYPVYRLLAPANLAKE